MFKEREDPEKRKERNRENRKKFRKEFPEKESERRVFHHRKLRIEILDTLGGKCKECGFSDYRALQVDHVNGDGAEDRKNGMGRNHTRQVIESFLNNENKYQLLCANCNWIKRVENKEYSTKNILENKWKRLVDKYLPDDNNTLEERIQERVNNELNGGVDPETQNPLLISVFTTKKPDSTFRNGILLSRDGIKYR